MIPVNLITGALGVGKTTAIANLLMAKAVTEPWLVILNEFTDTGIDTLTLAAAARGAYDVRMIPGGCLCCTGEEDFRRQLSGVLALEPAQWPARILIEPSGIGHPGAMVEELRVFERGGTLRLHSTIALVQADSIGAWDATQQAQVDAADVLLLAKAELATAVQREHFQQWAASLFPAKRWLGYCERGQVPPLALAPPGPAFSFASPRPVLHQLALTHSRAHLAAHDHAAQFSSREVMLAGIGVQATAQALLGREACGWRIPGTVLFDLSALQALLAQAPQWRHVERFKAVLRTGIDQWHLLQRWDQQQAIAACNWAQESRIEMQLCPGAPGDWLAWDRCWQGLSQRCPIG